MCRWFSWLHSRAGNYEVLIALITKSTSMTCTWLLLYKVFHHFCGRYFLFTLSHGQHELFMIWCQILFVMHLKFVCFFSIYCIQWTSWIKLCSLTVKTNQQKISRNRIKTNCCPSNNQLRQVFIILQWTLHSRTFYTCIYANFLDADLFSKLLKIKLCH